MKENNINVKRAKEFLKNAWRYSLKSTIVGRVLKSVFGDLLFEKLLNSPSIGYWPKIKDPRSFNEKIIHRKLFTNEQFFAKLSNKYTVREHVKCRLNESILNDVLYVGREPQKIPFEKLPNEFVVKAGNKGVIFVDEEGPEKEDIISKCEKRISSPYGVDRNEYWYGMEDQRVIVEKRIYGKYQEIPLDFKIFVFHGKVEYIQVDFNRFGSLNRRIYDRNWDPTDVKLGYPLGPKMNEPDEIDRMIHVSEKLAGDLGFVRVDLHIDKNNGVTFGEMTLAPGSGGTGFTPVSFDFEMGKHW